MAAATTSSLAQPAVSTATMSSLCPCLKAHDSQRWTRSPAGRPSPRRVRLPHPRPCSWEQGASPLAEAWDGWRRCCVSAVSPICSQALCTLARCSPKDAPASTSIGLLRAASGRRGDSCVFTGMKPDFRASGAALGAVALCLAPTSCKTLPCNDRTVSCPCGGRDAASPSLPGGGCLCATCSPVGFLGITRMMMRPDASVSIAKRNALPPPPLSWNICLRTASKTSHSFRFSRRPHTRIRSSRRSAPFPSTCRPCGRLSG
mmetsp:Transcript_1468/g.3051  ORF Transcript_1468/g.3051 Transcript_1468/m.3051 type:complete len:260 (-) Transcript_1468:80-859(-)